MCGISGIFAYADAAAPDESTLERMVDVIRHRGPDEHRCVCRGPVGLGVARLAVLDPDGSHQPLRNESGTVDLVFNGEIYNYQELRRELKSAGHVFTTKGDGEVIVHGYEQWGTGVFERLRGMFAIALWDADQECLVLARDATGIKPLYTCQTTTRLLFSSEVKSILAAGNVSADIRTEALDAYLAFRYVPAPDTLFRNVYKLRPGEVWVVSGTGDRRERFRRPVFGPEVGVGEEEAALHLYDLLSRSVEYRLQSDRPLGLFLSGGLDSGFLVALAREHRSDRLDTFSIGFDRGGIYDETGAAEVVAKAFGTRQHSVHMDAREFVSLLADAVYHMDEPMADPSAVPMLALSRAASEHVTVVLSGEGGDELFGGYPRYVGEAFASKYPVPAGITRPLAALAAWWGRRSLSRGLEGIAIRDERARHLFWQAIVPGRTRARLLGGTPTANQVLASSVIDRFAVEARSAGAVEPLDRLFYFDVVSWLVEDLLLKKDKMGMAASIEARVPYLDQDVAGYALRLPHSIKVRGLKGKRVFRRVLNGRLPDEILERPKIGFAVPLAEWFRGPLRSVLSDVLCGEGRALEPLLDAGAVSGLIRAHMRRRDHSLALYSLVVLEVWARIYLQGEAPHAVRDRLLARL